MAGPELVDFREVERHFAEHHFEDAFQETDRAWAGGNIRGNLLSPGLLTLLRHTVAEERRYPGKLTPLLCRQLSGRHVAVFKWRRKLKAGPSRPHPVPDKIVIADRLMSLLSWITENSGRKLEHLWEDLLPNEIGDEEKTGWYHDLHWLLNQGYVLLMADSTIHRSKRPGGDESKRPARKVARGKGKEPPAKGKKKARTKAAPAPAAPVEKQPRSGTDGHTPGLYALGGRKLGGSQHEAAALHARGLRPRCNRSGEDEPESEGDPELPT